MFKSFRNALLISVFAVVFAAFMGCSNDSHNYLPPPNPGPENADVTGFWVARVGVNIEDFNKFGALLKVTPTNGGDPFEGEVFDLIVEFPIAEQGSDGSFSYTGPITFMGVEEFEGTIEGQVTGNVVKATVNLEGAVLTFQGTATIVDGKTKITGTWTGTGEGIDIMVKGMMMKALAIDDEDMSGPFTAVIGKREQIIPRVAGIWEVLELPDWPEPTSIKPLCFEPEKWFVDVYQKGWVFQGDGEFGGFFGVIYPDNTVLIIGEAYGEGFIFQGTLNGDILTGTYKEIGDIFTVTNGNDDTVTARLHIRPYWHVISSEDASSIKNIFAWDRTGEMPEDVVEALAAYPYTWDSYLPINPEGTEDAGYLLPPAGGDYYAWWGSNPTGSYVYPETHSSSFTSDEITLPGGEETTVTLDLDYWYNIEDFEGWYDDLFVQILVQDEDEWFVASQFELTPQMGDGSFDPRLCFSTPAEWDGEGWVTGPDQTPEWVHFSQDISEFAGQTIKIRFLSATYDSELNQFRGHAVDNIEIGVDGGVFFFEGFEIVNWDEEPNEGDWWGPDSFGLQNGLQTIGGTKIPVGMLKQRSLIK